nr:hypothetical protein EUX21_02295 [synthetic Caulobacter sp. 'ethensis']
MSLGAGEDLCEPRPAVVLTLSLSKGENGHQDASTLDMNSAKRKGLRDPVVESFFSPGRSPGSRSRWHGAPSPGKLGTPNDTP